MVGTPPMRPRVILVTDAAFSDDSIVLCVERVARSLPPGWLSVQLRDKVRARASLRVFAGRLRNVTRREGAWLVVNRDAALARDIGAEGVHLGRDGGSVEQARATLARRCWVSVAAHSDEAVARAVAGGADAVLVSPVFTSRLASDPSEVKPGCGLELVRSARRVAGDRCLVYALGGVTPDLVSVCLRAGAFGVAAIRALLAASQPVSAARAIHDGFRFR